MQTAVKVFRIKGFMKLRSGEKIPFSIETTALTRDHAIEKILYELGSRHKLKRKHIEIISVDEISPDEISRQEIRDLLAIDKLVIFE